jgi:NitT/TauT family transport system ATP-binding protein
VLFVTHDVDEALALADRVAVLGATPGRVTTVVDVPHPRQPFEPSTPDTAAARSRILAVLSEETSLSEETALAEETGPAEGRQ